MKNLHYNVCALSKSNLLEKTQGTLFYDICQIAEERSPKVIFLENVRNLEKHDDGKTFLFIRESLQEMGYSVFHEILNPCHFGIPHFRDRVFIVAIQEKLTEKKGCDFVFPEKIYPQIVGNSKWK